MNKVPHVLMSGPSRLGAKARRIRDGRPMSQLLVLRRYATSKLHQRRPSSSRSSGTSGPRTCRDRNLAFFLLRPITLAQSTLVVHFAFTTCLLDVSSSNEARLDHVDVEADLNVLLTSLQLGTSKLRVLHRITQSTWQD